MKTTCVGCGAISECSCPEGTFHNHADAKYFCDVCIKLLEEGVPETSLKESPKRPEAAKSVKVDQLAETFADMMTDKTLGPIWARDKDMLKELSKKDLAQEAYYQGLRMGFAFHFDSQEEKEIDEMLATLDSLEKQKQLMEYAISEENEEID